MRMRSHGRNTQQPLPVRYRTWGPPCFEPPAKQYAVYIERLIKFTISHGLNRVV